MNHRNPNTQVAHQASYSDTVDGSRRRLLLGTGLALGAGAFAGIGWTARALAADTPMVRVVIFKDDGKKVGERSVPRVQKSAKQWRKQLSPEAFHILRKSGTEAAFSGSYSKPDRPGFYRCAGCSNALYDAATQFHSGTGWPSFWQPIASENVTEQTDHMFGMSRTAISCTKCQGHLGHVFNDGPKPTGLRYCMNSPALWFVATGAA